VSQTALSESDLIEYQKELNHKLTKLITLQRDSILERDEIIKRMFELAEPLSELNKLQNCQGKQDVTRWLWSELVKLGINSDFIGHTKFYELAPEHLKRKHDKNPQADSFIHIGELLGQQTSKSSNQKVMKVGDEIWDKRDIQKSAEKEVKESAKTLLREELKQSIVIEAVRTSKEFLEQFESYLVKMEDKFRENPKILEDFEKSLEWKELADMCVQLQELYKDEGSIIRQMHQETNFRAPATMLQLALAKTLQLLDTHRNWAHKLSVSPRQYQRIRQRLTDWPLKRATDVILKSLGSISCPNCRFNLVSKRKHPDFKVLFDKTKENEHVLAYLGDTSYSLPAKFQKEGSTPIRIAQEIFLGKLKPIVK